MQESKMSKPVAILHIGAWLLLAGAADAACGFAKDPQALLEVRPGNAAVITVCTDEVIREALPPTLFGFNIHHYYFERELFDVDTNAVEPVVATALSELPGALYRYPGGLVANRFPWEQSIGEPARRKATKSVKWDAAAPIRFGLDEYLDFVKKVDGQPWFVLNLVGWDDDGMFTELNQDVIAASNGRLAKYMRDRIGTNTPRYYQLGNELDRAEYQWPHSKYIERARLTMDAMRKEDPDAVFVAFLREFDWVYKGSEKERGVSRFQDYIRDVLTGLPDVNDFSMHFYYDAPNTTEVYRRIPWRLRQFRRAIDTAKEVRSGENLNVWITEHARGIDFGNVKARDARPYTSNLSAAISSSDFLIALAQIPEIQGASWHGLNATPWQVFDPQLGLQPNPVYWGFRVLREVRLPKIVATATISPNESGYAGGYDIRATAFTGDSDTRLGLWVVNRAASRSQVELRVANWQGRQVEMRHFSLAAEPGVDPDAAAAEPILTLSPEPRTVRFDASGALRVELPAASVSAIVFSVP